jgi:transcriptional regulator with XRE-family HTH domain
MPKTTLASFGPLVREKRGKRHLREAARDIGISAPTLMRIESGRVPDVETFGKVCKWLKVDPGDFLGFDPQKNRSAAPDAASADPAIQVSAHFRIDRLPLPETASALAKMLMFVAKREATGEFSDGDA